MDFLRLNTCHLTLQSILAMNTKTWVIFKEKSSHHTPEDDESCDRELKGWYRFVGAAGTKMPTTPVGPFRCGAANSGWLHDTHPTVEDSEVPKDVYFSANIESRSFKSQI